MSNLLNFYNLYSFMAYGQQHFQEEYNLINEINKLNDIVEYDELNKFIMQYSTEEVFKKEFSCVANINLLIEKKYENNTQTIHIKAKQDQKEIFDNYWTRILN